MKGSGTGSGLFYNALCCGTYRMAGEMKKKNLIAAMAMIILIVASIPLGIVRSVQPIRSDAENEYYYDDTGFAIYEGIDARVAACNNLLKVAEKYKADYPELRSYIDELEHATKKADNSYNLKDRAPANKQLDAPAQALANALKTVELSEADAKYPDTLIAEIQSQQDKISRSSYNEKAAEYNEVLRNFPVSLLARLGVLKDLPLFV